MYRIVLSVSAPNENEQAFQAAAADFLNNLRTVRDLNVEIPETAKPGTRGFLELLSHIVATGLSVGAFSAIYLFAKDLYDRCATAEVELKFSDGSALKLKGLTQAQAEAKMREHLEKQSP